MDEITVAIERLYGALDRISEHHEEEGGSNDVLQLLLVALRWVEDARVMQIRESA